jgi:hypothetical protein
MITLAIILTSIYFLGVGVLIFSESVCIELLRYFIADLSFDTIAKISGNPCSQPFVLYICRKIVEKMLALANATLIACTLGFVVWAWIFIWNAIINPLLTLKAHWDECNRQNRNKT